MNQTVKQIAIIGPTASGKSDLSITIAQKIDAYILSIDSLSIYKEIDIVSAKPSKEERESIKHFGIDYLCVNEHFSVELFIKIYKETLIECEKDGKNLIIVGGTSFYLKSLLEGISEIPKITPEVQNRVTQLLKEPQKAYSHLRSIDPLYMQKISPNDSYRIEKALLIHEASKLSISEWFEQHPPKPVIEKLDIFNIEVEREILKERINARTKKMISMGLIDEIAYLEQKYTRSPNAMGAIGIVEVLAYLDAKISLSEMQNLISIHTAQLAKRQETFNRTQFHHTTAAPLENLEDIILRGLV